MLGGTKGIISPPVQMLGSTCPPQKLGPWLRYLTPLNKFVTSFGAVQWRTQKIFMGRFHSLAGAELGGARGATSPQNFACPPQWPPKIFQASFWKSYTDHWQLPLLQNRPLQWPPQMKMSGSAPEGIKCFCEIFLTWDGQPFVFSEFKSWFDGWH